MLAGGCVNNRMASKGLRRRVWKSDIITISNGATSNLTSLLTITPIGCRLILDQFNIINLSNISNHALGAFSIGHALANGALTANSIVAFSNTTMDTNFKNTAIWKNVGFNSTQFANTLVTGEIKHPIGIGKPVVPANSSIIVTHVTMASSGTGVQQVLLCGWEYDDQQAG